MALFSGPLLPSGESPARLTTPRGRSPLAPSLLFSLAPVPNYSESMAICKPSKIVNDYLEKVAVKLTPGLPDVGDLPLGVVSLAGLSPDGSSGLGKSTK